MKNVYVLHGCCDKDEFEDETTLSESNNNWLPWLQQQLVLRGINCQTPEMPTPYKPSFHLWQEIFGIYPINAETSLVGHSCAGGFLLRFLAQTQTELSKLILVAPWLDPHRKVGDFLKFDLDPTLGDRVQEMHLFYSEDEPIDGVKWSVDQILATYPKCKLHKFDTHGHFCLEEMGTEAFPELLELLA